MSESLPDRWQEHWESKSLLLVNTWVHGPFSSERRKQRQYPAGQGYTAKPSGRSSVEVLMWMAHMRSWERTLQWSGGKGSQKVHKLSNTNLKLAQEYHSKPCTPQVVTQVDNETTSVLDNGRNMCVSNGSLLSSSLQNKTCAEQNTHTHTHLTCKITVFRCVSHLRMRWLASLHWHSNSPVSTVEVAVNPGGQDVTSKGTLSLELSNYNVIGD